MTGQLQGVARFQRRMRAIPQKVRAEVIPVMERKAEEIVQDMESIAPRRTGALVASIGWTWDTPPSGSVTLVQLKAKESGSLVITIYAGGAPETKRQQSRASGSRARDRNRSGSFDTDVARFQEFGTVNMPANPFFYPVWRTHRRSFKSLITRAAKRGMQKA